MARLTRQQQLFIVDGFAVYMTSKEVREAVREEYGIDIPTQQVSAYNPDHKSKTVAKDLKARFEETRNRYWEEIGSIPLAHKTHRLRLLSEMERKAREAKNYGLAVQIIEQASKEAGNYFTNKLEVKHKGSVKTSPKEELTEDQKRTMLELAVRKALGGDKAAPGTPTVQ